MAQNSWASQEITYEFVEEDNRRYYVGTGDCKFKVGVGLVEHLVPWERLKPWPENYRNGDIEKIKESLDIHGQFRDIVVNSGDLTKKYPKDMVLAGNHTYFAAGALKWTHMAIGYVDVADEEAEDIAIIDNASGDAAWNDEGALSKMLERKAQREQGLAGTGYDYEGLAKMLKNSDVPPPKENEEPNVPADVVIEIRCSYDRLGWIRETLDSWSRMKGIDVEISG